MTRSCWLAGITSMLFTGCVQPDPANPWSTKAQSAGSVMVISEPKTEVILARPLELTPLSRRDNAIAVLRRAVNAEHPLLRATAFEGLQGAPDLFELLAPSGLADENRGVRFVTAMSVAEVGSESLAPLLEPLLLDDSMSVQAAAIFALHQLGENVDLTPLATCVMEPSPEVRANTYIVLGRLGNSSAVSLIDASLQQDLRRVNLMRLRMAELQGAGALVQLGREDMIEPIRAALFAPPEQAERTLLACDLLGELRDEGAKPMLVRILSASGDQERPLEVRIAAAKALLQLDAPQPEGLLRVLFRGLADDDPRRRLQAVTAIAAAEGPEVESALASLVDDPDPMVAIIAAGAIIASDS